MIELDLKTNWELCWRPLFHDKRSYGDIINEKQWIKAGSLPCDVHMPLTDQGYIKEPLESDHSFDSEWIEDRSWWFKKVFEVSGEMMSSDICELVIEGLDIHADLFLNGIYLGHHSSAMYPFCKDVKDHLISNGTNLLIIRVTTGTEYFSDLDISLAKDYVSCEYKGGRGPRGDNRRALLRKPQYVFGWDWSPRIVSCGITGTAKIRSYKGTAVRSIYLRTLRLKKNTADIRIEAQIENLGVISTTDAEIILEIRLRGECIYTEKRDVFITSGHNYIEFDITLKEPSLWWPSGMGTQDLYDVKIIVITENGDHEKASIKTGIRTIELDTQKTGDQGRLFALVINGRRIFCKGGNWIPADAIYARVTDEKYGILVDEAREAGFNMLRMWGGGAYEREYFYDCCDRNGILIWQDLNFSCAAYPDELEWFKDEVISETDHLTKRLRNHPSVVLLCGNNECQGHLITYMGKNYFKEDNYRYSPAGTYIYNKTIPDIIYKNCPDIPYWNSSPYGGRYGDMHYWPFLENDLEGRIDPKLYDGCDYRFVSEFGFPGCCIKDSVYKYYGSKDPDMGSTVWRHHTNTWEKDTLAEAIKKEYGKGTGISIDEYLLYSGLIQGKMLGHALDSMRIAENNHGALIWSYNDAWGETGWSIIDYYLRRKISWYFVNRAFAPLRIVLREKERALEINILNDTGEVSHFFIEYGYISLTGSKKNISKAEINIRPYSKIKIKTDIQTAPFDMRSGVFYAKAVDSESILPASLRADEIRQMDLGLPDLRISVIDPSQDIFEISTDKFAHGVHFGIDEDIISSDKYFDLLPGEKRKIRIQGRKRKITAADVIPRSVML